MTGEGLRLGDTSYGSPDDDGGDHDSSETESGSGFLSRMHPLGWATLGLLAASVVATLVGTDFLIGNLAWWHWLGLILVVALCTQPRLLHGLRLGIDAIASMSRHAAWILSWVVFVVALFNVVTRYTAEYTEADIIIGEMSSVAWMAFALIFLLGVNYAIRDGVNPRIDFWWADWPPKRKAWLDFVLHLSLLLPFILVGGRILWRYGRGALGMKRDGTWPSGFRVWETWEQGNDAGNLPVGPIKAVMFVGFVLFGIQILSEVIKTGFVIIGRDDLAELKSQDAPLRVE